MNSQFVSYYPPNNDGTCDPGNNPETAVYTACNGPSGVHYLCDLAGTYHSKEEACNSNPMASCGTNIQNTLQCPDKQVEKCDCSNVNNVDICCDLLCNQSYWRDDEGDCINVSKQSDNSYHICFTGNKLTGNIIGNTLTLGKSFKMTLDKSSTKNQLVWVESDDNTKVNWYNINKSQVINPRKMNQTNNNSKLSDNNCIPKCADYEVCDNGKCGPTTCKTDDDCKQLAGFSCMEIPGLESKACILTHPTGYGCIFNNKLCKSDENCNVMTGKCEKKPKSSNNLPLILGLSGGLLVVIMIAFMLSRKR